jgi:hypothetical protein
VHRAAFHACAGADRRSGQSRAVPLCGIGESPGRPDTHHHLSKVERKNKAPVSKEILRVKLPKPSEVTLDNGLTVMILEDHRFPTVSVTLNISGAGALFEPANLPGLASGTAQLLRTEGKPVAAKPAPASPGN